MAGGYTVIGKEKRLPAFMSRFYWVEMYFFLLQHELLPTLGIYDR